MPPPLLPPPEPLDRICLGARHLQLAVPRARAERGRGLCGGGAPERTQRSRPVHAAGPAPPMPASQCCCEICFYANLQRPRYSLRKAPSSPRLPLLVPVPSFRLSALFLRCANKRVILDKWENWKRSLQPSTLFNYTFNRLNVSDFRRAGPGIKREAKENQEEAGVAWPCKIQEKLV